jgi:hypothetical protein
MKKSNLYIMTLCIVIIAGMYVTNVMLTNEYQKIDLTDPYKNYVSVAIAPYKVLDISGSNGYPIEIVHKKTNDIKVLRSRLNHFKSTLRNDTLFVKFTGSNIPMGQRFQTNTPPGIIIEKNALDAIISTNTHNRVAGFSNQDIKLHLKGNSLMEISNCNLQTMEIEMLHKSQLEFSKGNTVDSLDLKMANTAVVSLQKIDFRTINHTLKDSITVVLSKDAFKNIIQK